MHAEEARYQNDKVIADAILEDFKKLNNSKSAAGKGSFKKFEQLKSLDEGTLNTVKEKPSKNETVKNNLSGNSPLYLNSDMETGIETGTTSAGITEDKDFDYDKIIGINYSGSAGVRNISGLPDEPDQDGFDNTDNTKKPEANKKKNKSEFSKFLQMKKESVKKNRGESGTQEDKDEKILNIFKNDREQEPVILKLDKNINK